MKGKSSTLLLSYLLLVAVVAVGLCRWIGARPDENVALTGSVPADQSFPFDAESFLAEADCPECTMFAFANTSQSVPITFKALKRHRIHGLSLPDQHE